MGHSPLGAHPKNVDGSRDEAGSGVWKSVHGKGYFCGEFGARHCNQWGLYGVRVRQCRDATIFPNYFGQTCFITTANATWYLLLLLRCRRVKKHDQTRRVAVYLGDTSPEKTAKHQISRRHNISLHYQHARTHICSHFPTDYYRLEPTVTRTAPETIS